MIRWFFSDLIWLIRFDLQRPTRISMPPQTRRRWAPAHQPLARTPTARRFRSMVNQIDQVNQMNQTKSDQLNYKIRFIFSVVSSHSFILNNHSIESDQQKFDTKSSNQSINQKGQNYTQFLNAHMTILMTLVEKKVKVNNFSYSGWLTFTFYFTLKL